MSTSADLFALALRHLQGGALEHAQAVYRQILQINPNNVDAHNNLGNILVMEGRLAEGTECFRQALRGNANQPDMLANLGYALVGQGKLAEAAECYEQSLQLNPGNRMARANRALLRLLQEDFAGGWQDYEQRWTHPGKPHRSLPQPRWQGEPLDGKTILVHAEQGLGDTIQFARYLPMVQRRGGKVVFEFQPALHGLFTDIRGVDCLIAEGHALPFFEVQVPLLSLPGLFQTTLATIPGNVPYLHAEPELVELWRQAVAVGSELNIGIVWQGNPNILGDGLRSIPLKHFEALAKVPGVRLVSLQKGPGVEQIRALGQRFPILDLGNRLQTFSDTAAVMKNLDLIVTSDTSIPHLAGALGLPVWTVLQYIPDWRWFLGRSDCPWYPTMRLYRQSRLGDWDEVFERIAVDLRRRIV